MKQKLIHVHSTYEYYDKEIKDKNWTIRDTDNWTKAHWKTYREATHIKVWRAYTSTAEVFFLKHKITWQHKNCVIMSW